MKLNVKGGRFLLDKLRNFENEKLKITYYEENREEVTMILDVEQNNRIHLITFIRNDIFFVQLYLEDERITEEIRVVVSKMARLLIDWFKEKSKMRLQFITGSIKDIIYHEYIIENLERYESYIKTNKIEEMKEEIINLFEKKDNENRYGKTSYFPRDRIALFGEEGGKLAEYLKKWGVTDYKEMNLDYCPKETYLLIESGKWDISIIADRLKNLGFGTIFIQGI